VAQWLFYCYLFGVLLFGANFFLQVAVLVYQSYARPVMRDGRFRIVEISGNRAPCSFGNTIFINPEKYDWETYNQILIHEKVHISGRHTLDILLAEIAVVLQWFNPFVWLYRREVENNLEFLTDASVLEHREVERSAYQLSLLRVSAPHLPFSITNNYNQSLLKRRIVMMNSKRSSSHTVWKYFFLIPLLTGLVCALNKPAAFGAGTKNLPPRDGFGGQATGEKAGPVSRLRKSALWMTAAAAFADTGAKPKASADSGWWLHHDSLAGISEAPVIAYSFGDGDINAQLAQTEVLKDQILKANLARQAMALQLQQNVNVNVQGLGVQTQALNAQAQALDVQVQAFNLASAAPKVDIRIEDFRNEGDSDVLDGAWFATSSSTDGRINFEMKRESGFNTWNNSLWADKSEFNPFPGQGTVEFKLVREAGTVTFTGQFDGQEGFGHFHFTPDETYFAALKQMGIEEIDGRRFAFFNANIKKDYASMMLHSYPHLSTHELIAFARNHIDPDFIKYWQGAGIADLDNPRNLISLKSMQIDRAYVDELKAAGYDHLALRELLSLKSQHVDGAYIRELKAAGYDHVDVRELVSLKSMHIDSGYIASLRAAGYSGLGRNEIASLYSQRVTPEFIKGFRDIGYKDLSVRDLTSLKSMNITPEYVRGFRDIGYKDIEIRQLHSFKSQGITPEYVKAWRDLGYEDLNANQLSSLKAMGITPDFVKEFNKIGFDHIPVNLLGMLKSTGVNAEYVSKMKEKGFVSKDLGKYIRLKNDFN
jgi:hypothetical protein